MAVFGTRWRRPPPNESPLASNLDVQRGRDLGPGFLQCRFLSGRLGFVDGRQIVADGFWRRLGGLVDEELNSGLRHFNRYGINDHGSTLLTKTCQVAIYAL